MYMLKLLNHPFSPTVCNNVADIAIVIDTSGSIQRSNFREVVSFTKELIDGMDLSSGRISVGVMYYSEEATIQVRDGKWQRYPNKYDTLR